MIEDSLSLYSSVIPGIINDRSKFFDSILFSWRFIFSCSAASCCTFLFSLMFSSLSPFISVLWNCIKGLYQLFCTAVQREVCIVLRASFIEESIVLLILAFNLDSISLISLSLLVVMLAVSLASILIISSSMGLLVFVLVSSISMVDILLTTSSLSGSFGTLCIAFTIGNGSLAESTLFFAFGFSPVDLHLFFELFPSHNIVFFGLSVIYLIIYGCSSGCGGFIFLDL